MRVELQGGTSTRPALRRTEADPVRLPTADRYTAQPLSPPTQDLSPDKLRMLKFGLPLVPTPMGSRELKECLVDHGLEKSWPEIREAYYFAKRAHLSQKRDDGSDYYHHCARVAVLAVDKFGVRDPDAVKAALLHDVVEDTGFTLDEIRNRFGPKVAGYTELMTKPPRKPDQSYSERDAAYIKRIEDSGDRNAVAVKLADRYDNIEDAHLMPKRKKIERYLTDTEHHYIPLAHRHFPKVAEELTDRVNAIHQWASA